MCAAIFKTALRSAKEQMQFSARAYHRVLKLARIIADLVGEEEIAPLIWQKRCSTDRSWG